MSALASILIGAALRVGAKTVKTILEQQVGGVAGEIGGTVVDAIAKQAGVTVDELPTLPQPKLDDAVSQVEPIAPALILAEVEQQKEANRLMLAEMNKDTSFGWLWRPAGMWLMLACIAWYVAVRPLLNALLWSFGTGVQIEIGLDMPTFLTIFMTYAGLYMGGNTVIRAVKKRLMAGLQQVEGAYQRFGSMINTTVLLIGFGGLIWNAGADAEKRDAADRQNAARIELVEQRQIEKWVIHEDLHKNRLADVKAVEARADERLKGIETDVRKLNGITDNLSYRLTSNEQATSGIAQTVKDIQQSLSQQSGDLREIKVILDRIEKGAAPMTKVQDLPQIDALSGDDVFYVADASNPLAPDKKVQFSQMVPAGAKVTHNFRYEGGITIPTLAAGTEGSGTILIPGAVVGDHVVFNPTSALAADIGIISVRVSAPDTVSVKFRNFSGGSFSSAAIACVALVTRSTS